MEFIELKDFITVMQKNIDNYILNETTKGIMKYSISIGLDINEEKCKEWIKQAIEIENYTPYQIYDLKVKHLLKKKDKEIENLKFQKWRLELELHELRRKLGE